MTELLERAIAQLKTRSFDEQNAIAAMILEELEDEQRWDDSFARSPDLLAKLAAEAMAEHHAGKTQESENHGVDIPVDRDIASAQEICNRGQETYPGTLEKQEIVSQVGLSGAMCLDKWRFRGEMPISDDGKPTLYCASN